MMNDGTNRNQLPGERNLVDEKFEQNAGVKIHKGRERYAGGSGYYAIRSKPNCPNVCDERSGKSLNR